MKKVFLALAGLFLISGAAMAEDGEGDYNRIVLGINTGLVDSGDNVLEHNSFSTDDCGGPLYGATLMYLHGFELSNNKHIFLQTGLQFSVIGNTDNDDDLNKDQNWDLVSFTVPVNITKKFVKKHCFIEPYIGVNARLNVVGEDEVNGTKYDMFDENQAEFGTFNRAQFGGQIGFNVGFRHVCLGFEYNYESRLATFHNPSDASRSYTLTPHTITFSVGYAF